MSEHVPEVFHIRLASRFDEIEAFTAGAHPFLLARDVSESTLLNVDFCFEEVFTNVVKYGFPEGGEHWIDVTVEVGGDRLTLCIEDDGIPFDPRNAKKPDVSKPIEERPIGGLGLHLVQSLGATLDYKRVNGRNVLTIHLRTEPD